MMQRSAIDIVAITIGVVVSLRPAAPHLIFAQPPKHLCTVQNLGLLAVTGILVCVLYWILVIFIEHQSWYPGRSSSNVQVCMCVHVDMFVQACCGCSLYHLQPEHFHTATSKVPCISCASLAQCMRQKCNQAATCSVHIPKGDTERVLEWLAHSGLLWQEGCECKFLAVQNPLLTMMWVAILNGTLVPTVSFAVDTYGFSQRYSGAEIALFTLYGITCLICSMLAPSWFDAKHVFRFYSWPFSFVWKLYSLGLGLMIIYWVSMHTLQYLLDRHTLRRQMAPQVL